MKIKERVKKIDYRHYILICITILFLWFSLFYFTSNWTRFIESCKDIYNSVKFYIQEMFNVNLQIVPTINNKSVVPMTPIFNLPATWEDFVIEWNSYWQLIISKENIVNYINNVANILFVFSKYFLLFGLPAIIGFVIMFHNYLNKQNNDYNKDSKALILYKKFTANIYIPVKNWFCKLIYFTRQNKVYIKIWLFIWAWNFNLFFIIIEFLAFYLYFVASFNLSSIYIQIYKLFCDLTTPIAFIPTFIWLLIGIVLICKFRRKIGYARLIHNESKNCGFINERPIVMMVCGTMGKKKTTIITDIALSQEIMLREKAFEKLIENDLKFPHFPWINLENTLRKAIKKHKIYNLASVKKYISHLQYCFNVGWYQQKYKKCIRRHLKKDYCCDYDNLLFDYEINLFGYLYDDKLKVLDLWQVIETYSQLYFIYIIQSSLILSNYSIRTDNLVEDIGNFPVWDNEFFKRDSKLIDSISKHSHIIDFDSLRLGKKLVENNPNKDSFEFGVVNLTEIGKERKNNLELNEKKKNDNIANQKNDGFNDWLKMVRHSATVDMFPFVKVITDEQRPESWGADARDLLDIVHIKDTSEFKLLMPFFTITELLYHFVFEKFENIYSQYRFNRSDNTLFMHIVKGITAKFNHYYKGIYNTFGCCTCNLQVENGTQDGQLDNKKYYLMSKKIYSNRFSTDCFSDFFVQKALKSSVGIEDLKEYATERASFEELKLQNSYFINDLMNKKDTDNE